MKHFSSFQRFVSKTFFFLSLSLKKFRGHLNKEMESEKERERERFGNSDREKGDSKTVVNRKKEVRKRK